MHQGETERCRAIALDVGDRRIGVALEDELGFLAHPLVTMHRKHLKEDLRSVARLIRKHTVTDVVIGLPLHASGAMSPQGCKSEAFARAVEELGLGVRVHLLDERWTTAEAHALLDRSERPGRGKAGRRERTLVIDQIAAVLLLEAYLGRAAVPLLPEQSE